MEYKLVDVTGGEQGTFIFGVEKKIQDELAQGWQLWGSLIVIPPDFEGDQIQVWQAMVKEFEPEPMIYGHRISAQRIRDFLSDEAEADEVMSGIANSPVDYVYNGVDYDEELDN